MQEAAAGLRTATLRHTEIKVERHISFLATLQEDRGAELQSGHNTGLIRDKCVTDAFEAVAAGAQLAAALVAANWLGFLQSILAPPCLDAAGSAIGCARSAS